METADRGYPRTAMLTTKFQSRELTFRMDTTAAKTDSFPIFRANWYEPCKVALEFIAALVLLLLAAPVIFLAAAIIKLTSRGPAFYSQTRLGLHGRRFTLFKLRSMFHDAERDSGVCWSIAGDTRITPVGKFLRQ